MYRYNYRDWQGIQQEVKVTGTIVIRQDDIRLYVTKHRNGYAVHYGLETQLATDLADAMRQFSDCFCHAAECGDLKALQTSKLAP
jgi:hypothetical protein